MALNEAPTKRRKTKMLRFTLFTMAVLIVCAVLFRNTAEGVRANHKDKVADTITMFEGR
jgi:hypothetical protein